MVDRSLSPELKIDFLISARYPVPRANGTQGGDPAKLARALVSLDQEAALPPRFFAGADAIATAEQKVATLKQQIDAYRALSSSLAIEE